MNTGLTICGLGPGAKGTLTEETTNLLLSADHIYLRTEIHPVVHDLVLRGMKYTAFDHLYESAESFEMVYDTIVTFLAEEAKTKSIVYGVPGNPICGELTVKKLISVCKKENIPYEVMSAVSFVDTCMTAVGYDPIDGLMVLDALSLEESLPEPKCALLITQIYNRHVAGETKLILGETYSDDTKVALISADPVDGMEKIHWMPLYEIDRDDRANHLTSLFIPPQQEDYRHLSALEHIMSALRAPGGCPWDRAQTHESLRTYLLEETYEAVDAIDHGDIDNFIEELGDILLQIVFHAQIGKEKGYFNMGDVLEGICRKMIRRHPHVFGEASADSPEDVNRLWEQVKGKEKGEEYQSKAMDRIPHAFPALMRAHKIQSKARKDGFDWDNAQMAFPKISEETAEVAEAMERGNRTDLIEEIGDLLFAVVNVARLADIDSELALKQACDKFVSRYVEMEALAAQDGKEMKDYSLDQQEALWEKVKALKGQYESR